MEIDITPSPPPNSEQTFQLCAEALTSINPPLCAQSIDQILEIERSRVAELEGAEKFHAFEFFEAVRHLPPVIGKLVHSFLSRALDTDFSTDALVALVYQMASENPRATSQVSEWGFIEARGELVNEGANGTLTIDEQKTQREGMSGMATLCNILRNLNSGIRRLLIEDLEKIVPLRLSFDFSVDEKQHDL